jgi:hypothetical protein
MALLALMETLYPKINHFVERDCPILQTCFIFDRARLLIRKVPLKTLELAFHLALLLHLLKVVPYLFNASFVSLLLKKSRFSR